MQWGRREHLFWQQLPLGGSSSWIFSRVAARVVEVSPVHPSHLLLAQNQNPSTRHLTRKQISSLVVYPAHSRIFLKEELVCLNSNWVIFWQVWQLRRWQQELRAAHSVRSSSISPAPVVFDLILRLGFEIYRKLKMQFKMHSTQSKTHPTPKVTGGYGVAHGNVMSW